MIYIKMLILNQSLLKIFGKNNSIAKDLNLGLDFVNKLQPRKFKWNHRHTDSDKGKQASGFIAQEVKEAIDKHNLKDEGLLATCIQHEIDHLEGILFIDYLSKLKKEIIIKKLSKQQARPDRIIV